MQELGHHVAAVQDIGRATFGVLAAILVAPLQDGSHSIGNVLKKNAGSGGLELYARLDRMSLFFLDCRRKVMPEYCLGLAVSTCEQLYY